MRIKFNIKRKILVCCFHCHRESRHLAIGASSRAAQREQTSPTCQHTRCIRHPTFSSCLLQPHTYSSLNFGPLLLNYFKMPNYVLFYKTKHPLITRNPPPQYCNILVSRQKKKIKSQIKPNVEITLKKRKVTPPSCKKVPVVGKKG